MKKNTLIRLFSVLMLFSCASFTQHSNHLCNMVESTDEHIPVEADTGINQETFNRVIDNFTTVYKNIVKEQGFKLSIARKWSDETINANTTVSGSSWVINAYGGLARYPLMDYNAYLMVMCHEMGHHLAGYPANDWASNEGQSDYYASMKCFRRMANAGFVENLNVSNVPSFVKTQCKQMHKLKEDIILCEKGAETGFTLASILSNLGRSKKPLNFDTPDKSEVAHTNDNHPAAQCRLDTYFAGSVCGVPYDVEFSRDEPKTGACSEENKEKIAFRPHCWYKPSL